MVSLFNWNLLVVPFTKLDVPRLNAVDAKWGELCEWEQVVKMDIDRYSREQRGDELAACEPSPHDRTSLSV
jgi:hypothetical protein